MEQYGPDYGKTILCVPGTFMEGSCFGPLAQQMPDCRMICVTLNGHHPGSEFTSLDNEVETLVHMLTERGVTQFDLALGLSLGTVVALELTARPGIQIDRLVLDGAVNLYTSKCQPLEQVTTYFFLNIFRKILAKNSRNPEKGGSRAKWDMGWQKAASYVSSRSLHNIVGELVHYQPKPGLKQPIFLLYGSKEANYDACCKAAQSCFHEVHIDVKEGHNHLTWLGQHPEEYAGMLYGVMGR
ncbi:MAG: alpha/beta hydrolase [Clostridiales bacterium]|nr:alpha/beta hydrolase [Clostridiales bacterium]